MTGVLYGAGERPPGVRDGGVPEVPRRAGPWLRPGAVRRLRPRTADTVQLQGARLLSELPRPVDGRSRSASCRARLPARRADATVGALGPASAALSAPPQAPAPSA